MPGAPLLKAEYSYELRSEFQLIDILMVEMVLLKIKNADTLTLGVSKALSVM